MQARRCTNIGTVLTLILFVCVFQKCASAAESQGEPSPIAARPTTTPSVDKGQFNLFNLTPADQMRAFNPDRPSVTEGPYTVDAGHFQAEFSFVEYTYDYDQSARTDAFSVLPSNIRIGLLNNLEADFQFDPYDYSRVRTRTATTTLSGFGTIALRAKLNVWGNDGGPTVGGLLPYVTFPTGSDGLSNHHVEGGLILPFAMQLPAGFDLGTMADFQINRNADNTGYGMDLLYSVTLGHDVAEGIAAYIEYVGIAPVQMKETYSAYFDTGLTFALAPNVQLDVGINIGLSHSANDLTVFSGLSFRL